MTKSKEWDWKKVEDKIWLEPSEDGVYLAEKWKKEGISSVLDLGCGLGRHSILFSKKGYTVSAVDLSKDAIQFLEEWKIREKQNFICKVSDMKKLQFSNDSFDSIFSYHVISHSDTEGVQEVINEMIRVLKPSGKIFVTLCSKEHYAYLDPKFPKIDENTVLKTEGAEIEVPHFFADKKSIKKLFSSFKIERLRHITECNTLDSDSKEHSHYYIEATLIKMKS